VRTSSWRSSSAMRRRGARLFRRPVGYRGAPFRAASRACRRRPRPRGDGRGGMAS
jgi:hypothetical protein